MLLTDQQKDALTEVINIGFSRSASSLSELTGHRVLLEVPRVSIHPIQELQSSLGEFVDEEIATVHQIFDGIVSGDAMLMLNQTGALHLSRLLTDAETTGDRLYESDREVLTEVGNILLNACLGTFGNMLKVHIGFAVPASPSGGPGSASGYAYYRQGRSAVRFGGVHPFPYQGK